MCSICGIVDFIQKEKAEVSLVEKMGEVLKHRGPDQSDTYYEEGIALQHNRLAVIDIENGLQPMTRSFQGKQYTIVYNGEIYNSPELRSGLQQAGMLLKTQCDTEIVLMLYILYKEKCVEKLNGIFAFAVWDQAEQKVFLARDRFGIKPLFYRQQGTTFLFASEVKAILKYPGVKAVVDQEGLWQLIYMAPTKIGGTSVFKDIFEMPTGCCGFYSREGLHIKSYWQLQAKGFTGTEEEAAYETRRLLKDAIEKQLVSDVPLATLLSGGLDSSVITSVAASKYQEEGRKLSSYSFEYTDNRRYFHSTLFQPQSDDDYAFKLAQILGTSHHILTADIETIVNLLGKAACSRDLPGMADIDSSLLYYCSQIKKEHTVVLSGECADEIFGGYPWFYRKEMLENGYFPWIHQAKERAGLFNGKKLRTEEGYDFVRKVYEKSVAECPVLPEDSPSMRQSRIATWLSVNYFMTSLLERKDRMSMASGVEVRVPFADHRILEYVYNVPWEIKFKGGVEKALLREAMSDTLPELFLKRKKSPYPKTHHPLYEKKVTERLAQILRNPESRIAELIDERAAADLMQEANVTWFGQLMSRPQLFGWLIQLEAWLEAYDIDINIQ